MATSASFICVVLSWLVLIHLTSTQNEMTLQTLYLYHSKLFYYMKLLEGVKFSSVLFIHSQLFSKLLCLVRKPIIPFKRHFLKTKCSNKFIFALKIPESNDFLSFKMVAENQRWSLQLSLAFSHFLLIVFPNTSHWACSLLCKFSAINERQRQKYCRRDRQRTSNKKCKDIKEMSKAGEKWGKAFSLFPSLTLSCSKFWGKSS